MNDYNYNMYNHVKLLFIIYNHYILIYIYIYNHGSCRQTPCIKSVSGGAERSAMQAQAREMAAIPGMFFMVLSWDDSLGTRSTRKDGDVVTLRVSLKMADVFCWNIPFL